MSRADIEGAYEQLARARKALEVWGVPVSPDRVREAVACIDCARTMLLHYLEKAA